MFDQLQDVFIPNGSDQWSVGDLCPVNHFLNWHEFGLTEMTVADPFPISDDCQNLHTWPPPPPPPPPHTDPFFGFGQADLWDENYAIDVSGCSRIGDPVASSWSTGQSEPVVESVLLPLGNTPAEGVSDDSRDLGKATNANADLLPTNDPLATPAPRELSPKWAEERRTSEGEEENVGRRKQRVSCNVCRRKLTRISHLREHFISMHMPDHLKPFQCRLCGKGFARARRLWDHYSSHNARKHKYQSSSSHNSSASTQKSHIHCPLCDQNFDSLASFETHLKPCKMEYAKRKSIKAVGSSTSVVRHGDRVVVRVLQKGAVSSRNLQ